MGQLDARALQARSRDTATAMMPTYDRAPSGELQEQLLDGALRSLLSVTEGKVAGCRLDVHLRANDEVHVYCGLTRPLVTRLKASGDVRVGAAKSYINQECAKGLFGLWPRDTVVAEEFGRRLTEYLSRVDVASRWVRREGGIQARWSRVSEPWEPIDREAVLGYPSATVRVQARDFPVVKRARNRIEKLRASKGWARLPGRGGEVDQLAVDQDGRLVVIELKYAKASGVYYAPLQLLQYVWEWHRAFDAVHSPLQRLLDARTTLNLTSAHVPSIGVGIRPVVGFGADVRSEEVKCRYDQVLRVVNDHLPHGVPAVETWALDPLRRVG